MNKKIASICYSEHHVQKSLLLRRKFKTEVKIYVIKNNSLINFDTDYPVIINSKFSSNFDTFIFFTLQPNKINILLYELIRREEKKIIAFQESNQLEMHDGDVNNLILNADLIIAASHNEKIELIKHYYHEKHQIKSFGWLFNEDLNIRNDDHINSLEYILLILSAPNYITASSYETLSFRKKLIYAITFLHPNKKILIRPHPLEDLTKINALIKSFAEKNFKVELLEKHKDFFNAINSSQNIYMSNRTQSCIDMIDTEKLILYKLGSDNFITEHGLNYANVFQKNEINFIDLSSKECIYSFNKKYINNDQETFQHIESTINNISTNINRISLFNYEIQLWRYLYRMISKKSLRNFLKENELNNEVKIIDRPEIITEQNFKALEKNFSIRSSFFLIYVRGILQKNILMNENIETILSQNITRWFSQYHAIDSVNLYYYLKVQNKEKKIIEKNTLELIINTIKIYKEKSIGLKIFLYIQDRISMMTGSNTKMNFFWSLNFMWDILRRIKT